MVVATTPMVAEGMAMLVERVGAWVGGHAREAGDHVPGVGGCVHGPGDHAYGVRE